MTLSTTIAGTGSAYPETKLTSAELAERLTINHPFATEEWIERKTGVKERRISQPGSAQDRNSMLALHASRRAIQAAGLQAADIDMIAYATCTPDTLIPATACWLQGELGATQAAAFDLNAACAGFVYALTLANSLVLTGVARNCLVVGSDVLSAFTDWDDPRSCILFGDGAGAVVLSKARPDSGRRFVGARLSSRGKLADIFTIPGGGSRLPVELANPLEPQQFMMQMQGRVVRDAAISDLCSVSDGLLQELGMTAKDVDWLIPHQANLRIIESVASNLGISMDCVLTNIDLFGNTSAATVPTLLDQAVRQGRLVTGQTVLLAAFGAGVTSGAVLLEW